jgi:hypothetical protein
LSSRILYAAALRDFTIAAACCATLGAGALPLAGQTRTPPVAGAPVVDAHADAPVARAVRREGRLSIDGRLDEEEWRRAEVVTNFIQTDPNEGVPPSERTEVYIMFDDDALYIGARLWDSTGQVRSRLGRRDAMLGDSDWFSVMIDSHHDHLTAYQFSANPAGVKRDEVTNGGWRGDASWDAVWDLGTSVDDEGWTVEIRIPFSQLRFSAADMQTWGIQFSRRINALQEVSVFAFTPRRLRGGVARYGHLEGIEGIKPGKRLEAMPYSLARAERVSVAEGNPFRSGRDYFSGFGVDAKYRITSALTIDATINPDFGQVEVDPAVVNLSASETSLQERRPFFVEGADIFRFADARLFNSRRIGRAPQGSLPGGLAFSDRPSAATILGAAKLSGRTATGWTVGLVQALTGEESAPWVDREGMRGETVVEPMTNYLAGRLMRDFRSGQSQVGIIGTAVNRRLDEPQLERLLRRSAYSGGIDFSHEFLNRTWSLQGALALSHVEGSEEAMLRTQLLSSRYYQRPDAEHISIDPTMTSMQGFGAKFDLEKLAGLHWRGTASVSAVSPGFEINDMGFQTGVDRIATNLNVTYVESQPSRYFRNWRISGGPQVNWNFGGDWIGGRGSLNMNGQFANFWNGMLSINKRIVGLDDRLTRGGPLTRDRPGQSVNGHIMTDSRRMVSGRVGWNYSWGVGEGLEQRLNVNASVRPADNWSFSFGPSVSRNLGSAQYVTAVTDSFATATFGRRYIFSSIEQTQVSMDTRLNVNFTPELSLELFMQPLIATGDFQDLKQLRAPRTFDFDVLGRDVGTVTYNEATRVYSVDPDGDGPARAFNIANRDFNTRSLRGNAVMRWEYRPGSTMYLVWQQRRSESFQRGDFDFFRDGRGLLDARPDNIFVFKLSYWLNL